jgi:hypothetical protein
MGTARAEIVPPVNDFPKKNVDNSAFGGRMQVEERILKSSLRSCVCFLLCFSFFGGMNARTTGQKWMRGLAPELFSGGVWALHPSN